MATIATRSLGFSIHSRYDGDGVRRARRDIDDFTRSVNRSSSALNSSSGRFMLYTKAALLFGPALVPIAANLTANPFASVTTVTVQIVQLLTGDQEFDSAKTLAAFALGLVLFLITLARNLIALSVVRRYREAYE